jgi:alpha-mannosidase
MGYTTLTVKADTSGKATRYPTVPGLATSERSMANEYLDITIESNGTVTLIDKLAGQTYHRLLTFEDAADIGDGWYHGQAVNEAVYVSTASSAAVALIQDGPEQTCFRVRTTMLVPQAFHFDDRMARSENLTELVIDNYLTLRAASDRLEVKTVVHNNSQDHRLRVLFPSGASSETYWADTPFDVVERPISLRRDNHLYRELEVETRPQQSWTAVFDNLRGLAVISQGLLETAIQDHAERTLALTLFRSTRRTVMTNGEPGGQLQGTMTFRYWIIPLVGQVDAIRLCQLGQQIAAGLRTVQLNSQDLAMLRTGENLPTLASFFRVEGPAILTSLRRTNIGLEARLFNPTKNVVEAILHLDRQLPFQNVESVNFESRPISNSHVVTEGMYRCLLQAKQIVTLRFIG